MRGAGGRGCSVDPLVNLAARVWNRPPAPLRAVLAGLVVTAGGTVPWVLAATLNVRLTPRVPWAGPAVAVWVWLYWRFLSGHVLLPASAAARRQFLQVRPLASSEMARTLLFLATGFAALIAGAIAVAPWLGWLAPRGPTDLARYPAPLVFTGLVMTAVVAGVSEEAGFRGVMQSMLDRSLGPVASTTLVATVFALAHLSHGLAPGRLVVNAIASAILSLGVRRCGSIVPGIAVHTASDIVVPVAIWLWPVALASAPARPVGAACALLLTVLSAWAYRRLGRTSRPGPATPPAT